ncbi:uncharacterized protein LOC142587100 isoform X2 [Dermacentor variabilis]|uniref:uncharacterized protein LOC142587100 isoform X2 n=1 Tax=Dermacentor variabilis TaxID=34621 RepID=UPI003F5BBC4F
MTHILVKCFNDDKWNVYPLKSCAHPATSLRLMCEPGCFDELRGRGQDACWREGTPKQSHLNFCRQWQATASTVLEPRFRDKTKDMNSCHFLLGFMLIHFGAAKPSGPVQPECPSRSSCSFGQKGICGMKDGIVSFVKCSENKGILGNLRTSG